MYCKADHATMVAQLTIKPGFPWISKALLFGETAAVDELNVDISCAGLRIS